MADYYQILGLSKTASSNQIRAAFKRLAMQYHPDRNPGNPMAEEIFKQVNEAYHTLSDLVKKSKYDSRFYSYQTQAATQAAEEHWRDIRRKQQQQTYRTTQPKERTYTITGNYFKIQGLAFLVFLIMSGISFGIVHTASFFFNLKRENERREHKFLVNEVNVLFGSGKIDEAIGKIIALNKLSPLDFQFRNAHDSLVSEIKNIADRHFELRNFEQALYYYQYFKKYGDRGKIETLRKISACQYATAQYADALQSLKQLHSEQPWSLELIYQIAVINIRHINNTKEAMFYFNMGENVFRENMTKIYGEAFMIALDPKNAPDIYFEIFIAKANAEITLKEYEEAEKDLALAVYLRPERPEGYRSRAEMNIHRKRYTSACTDLQKASTLGATDIKELQSKYCL